MFTEEERAEIRGWNDIYMNIGLPDAELLDLGDEVLLRERAIKVLKKFNYIVNYFDSRMIQLKGDLAESKIFGSIIQGQYLAERISELEALMEAGTLDTVV